jgi:hypothetical protein
MLISVEGRKMEGATLIFSLNFDNGK